MRAIVRMLLIGCLLSWTSGEVRAQFKDGSAADGAKIGDENLTKWKTGVVVKAMGGACKGLAGYTPIPVDWPEQKVTIIKEDISPEAKVTYQTVNETVKVMMIKIGYLESGSEAHALVTYEIRRNNILPPDDADVGKYVIPDVNKLKSDVRQFLSPSPKIESNENKIRDLARETTKDKETAWEKVEAIYDCARSKVKYQNGPLKGALQALKDGTGDCEEITSLIIAMCRAINVPARTVWVPGHCYPEFYLQDGEGAGHWFPCQAAGTREFGGILESRPILQKGDNFKPLLGKNASRQRYLAEYLTGTPTPGGGKPQVRFVRQQSE